MAASAWQRPMLKAAKQAVEACGMLDNSYKLKWIGPHLLCTSGATALHIKKMS